MGSLGLNNHKSSNSGDFKVFCKYNAQAGRLYRTDRVQDVDGNWRSVDTDITKQASFVIDMANLWVGWISFGGGGGPIRYLVPYGQELGPKPDGDFKQGFLLYILLPKDLDDKGPRELSSTAQCAIDGVAALLNEYNASEQSQQGKLPVVRLGDPLMVKSGAGERTSTNFQPVFEILAWVDRPRALEGIVPSSAARTAAPVTQSVEQLSRGQGGFNGGGAPTTGSTRVKAPDPRPAVDALDFG